MIYISTASLVAPMGHDWFCIYAWLFRRWRPEQGVEIFGAHEGAELNVNQQEDLAQLRRWIFQRQMEHLKRKLKGGEEPEQTEREPKIEHPKLF